LGEVPLLGCGADQRLEGGGQVLGELGHVGAEVTAGRDGERRSDHGPVAAVGEVGGGGQQGRPGGEGEAGRAGGQGGALAEEVDLDAAPAQVAVAHEHHDVAVGQRRFERGEDPGSGGTTPMPAARRAATNQSNSRGGWIRSVTVTGR
jgi:hypothetical protein